MSTRSLSITFFLLLSTLAAAQIWLSHLRVELAQSSHLTQQDINTLQENIQKLGLEYASLARPERLRRLAHKQLGMQAPRPMQVFQP
ncbi:MAG: cell division protein FtsL [Mariprofundaceae bacterium]